MEPGSILRDVETGELVVLVECRGSRILVSGMASLKPDATLLERATQCVPAEYFELVQV